jgi:chorismate mutase
MTHCFLVTLMVAIVTACASAQPVTPLQELIRLSANRVQLADRVAASKRASGKPVEDPIREAEQLQKLAEVAAERHIPQERVTAFFRAQIEASKLVQYELLAREHQDNGATPALEDVRAKLDGINNAMLERLPSAWGDRDAADCDIRVRAAIAETARQQRLDRLHRLALVRSLGDFCRRN